MNNDYPTSPEIAAQVVCGSIAVKDDLLLPIIRDAIAARNPLLAQDTLRRHLEFSRSRLVEEIENGNG